MNWLVSADLGYRLGWTLLHSVWQGVAVAIILGAGLALLRHRSPQARYAAGIAAMALLVLCLGATFWMVPPPQMAATHRSSGMSPAGEEGNLAAAKPGDSDADRSVPSAVTVELSRPRPAGADDRDMSRWTHLLPRWVAGVWAVGVLLLSLRQLGGWVAAQRLRTIGVRTVDAGLTEVFASLSSRLGLRQSVQVVESSRVETPLLIGWLRPVVLMPAAVLNGLSAQQLEAILAHELAHVRRHDCLVNLIQVAVETLLFYHPAVWWISRRVRLEREQCCDDVAVGVCGDRCGYVESLAALEEVRLTGSVAMATRGSGGSQLIARVQRLLGRSASASRHGTISAAMGALLAGVAITLALCVHRRSDAAGERPAAQPRAVEWEAGPASRASTPLPRAPVPKDPTIPSARPATMPTTRPAIEVTVETRFYSVDPQVLQDLGVDFKIDVPLLKPGAQAVKGAILDDFQCGFLCRALAEARSTSVLAAPRLTLWGDQTGAIKIGAEQDPVLNVLVAPDVSPDRKTVKLNLHVELTRKAEQKVNAANAGRRVQQLDIAPRIPDHQTFVVVLPDAPGDKEAGPPRQHTILLVTPKVLVAPQGETLPMDQSTRPPAAGLTP